MRRLFGTAKEEAPKAPAPTLSDTTSRIDSRVQALDEKISKCDEDLRRYMAPGRAGPANKQLALQTMKRKKMYEQQRDQIMGTQFNVESLAFAQEQAEITAMSVEAMKAGHADLKQRYAAMGGAGDVERLMDDLADLQGDMSEINEALATSYSVPEGFDEADCDAEFAALEEEMKMDALCGVPAGGAATATSTRPSYLPAAPSPVAAEVAAPAAASALPAGS